MADQPRDATAEELKNEEAVRRFEAEAAFRQSNTLPMDQAMNEGRFYGLLIRGNRPLTSIQRIGFLLIALLLFEPSLLLVFGAVPHFTQTVGGEMLGAMWMLYALLAFLAGLRVVWVALKPSQEEKGDE